MSKPYNNHAKLLWYSRKKGPRNNARPGAAAAIARRQKYKINYLYRGSFRLNLLETQSAP